jgi:hypothetical protein
MVCSNKIQTVTLNHYYYLCLVQIFINYYYYFHLVWIFQQNILKLFSVIIHFSYTIFIHDTLMYIYITYVDAQICQGLNPSLHEGTPRFSPPKHFKTLMK